MFLLFSFVIFFGNQVAYDIAGNLAITTSTIAGGLTQISNLTALGNSGLQATKAVTTQYVATLAASYGGGQLVKLGAYHLSKDVFELTESQSQSNAKMAEIFGTIATGIVVSKPIKTLVDNKFGINTKIPTEKLLNEKAVHSEKFDNWASMKEAHKGTVTKFVQENKPMGSPALKKWFEKGGTVQIDTLDNGTQIWKYTNSKGVSVSYLPKEINGKIVKIVEFPEEVMYLGDKELSTVDIGQFTGNRNRDIELAKEILANRKITNIKGYVLHHDYKNGIIQLIDKEVHREFTHYGGYYLHK